MKAFCTISNIRRLGEIVKKNNKTVQMRIIIGAKHFIVVKRHIIKHNVVIYEH